MRHLYKNGINKEKKKYKKNGVGMIKKLSQKL